MAADTLAIDLLPLQVGDYTIEWRVLSVDTLSPKGNCGSLSSRQESEAGLFALEAIVGALRLFLLALVVGALITAAFLLTSSETLAIRRRLVCTALVLGSVFLVVHFLSLIVQGMKLSGDNLPSADILTRYVLRTESGKIWLFRTAYTIVFLLVTAIFLRRGHKPIYLFLLSLPLVASRSLSSHAAAVRDNTALAIVVDAVHLIATALWAGGLPFLFYSLLQESQHPILHDLGWRGREAFLPLGCLQRHLSYSHRFIPNSNSC